MSSGIEQILAGGRTPGDATDDVLWQAFKDVVLFASLRLAFMNDFEKPDKETTKAEMLERWEDQARLDFSRQLEVTRQQLSNPLVMEEFETNGLPKPDLGKVENEFDIHLSRVKGMAVRLLDLI